MTGQFIVHGRSNDGLGAWHIASHIDLYAFTRTKLQPIPTKPHTKRKAKSTKEGEFHRTSRLPVDTANILPTSAAQYANAEGDHQGKRWAKYADGAPAIWVCATFLVNVLEGAQRYSRGLQ
jgi:hypothetical protein